MQELLFATPLWQFQHPDPQACQAWAAHVLALEGEDPARLQLTNQGGGLAPPASIAHEQSL